MASAKDVLSKRESDFCIYFLETDNVTQSAIKAGYSEKTAHVAGTRVLKRDRVQKEIQRLRSLQDKEKIADANEVMQYFSAVMRGEIKDQFGLEASLSERTRAAQELAKRTVDIDNRSAGVADAKVQISLDWNMGENE